MKLTKLTIKNIGIIADAVIPIDKPLLIFYGEVRQGKSTILQAVRWVLGGTWPQDIIRHGEKEASIELEFDGGLIGRTWYWTKAAEGKPSEIKARAVQFIRNGRPVENPGTEIKRLCNPFIADQQYLAKKNESERKQYFSELFAVDTTGLDSEAFHVSQRASALRSKLTGYGDIDLTEIKRVDTEAIRQEIKAAKDAHAEKVKAAQGEKNARQQKHNTAMEWAQSENDKIREANARRETIEKAMADGRTKIAELERMLGDVKDAMQKHLKDLEALPPVAKFNPFPGAPDTSDLDAVITSQPNLADLQNKLTEAGANNVRAEQYERNVDRDAARMKDEAELKRLEERGRAIKREKIAALSKVSEESGVPGLAFREDGSFIYEGTDAGMLSTSQLMRLSSAISALYPSEFGIELLDRGESLGRSIFDYVKHAETKKISVLATVVGERPAEVPENVGVFVVEDGVVMKEEE